MRSKEGVGRQFDLGGIFRCNQRDSVEGVPAARGNEQETVGVEGDIVQTQAVVVHEELVLCEYCGLTLRSDLINDR